MGKSNQRREFNYQLLKLMHSGRSLAESMALAKTVMFGLRPNVLTNPPEKEALEKLEAGFHKLGMMRRAQAKDIVFNKFFKKRKDHMQSVEGSLANFALSRSGRISEERDGNLIRRGPPNKPRPGTFAGKASSRVIGAKQTLSNLKRMLKQINKIGMTSKDAKFLRQAYSGISKQVTQSIPKK